ncbi:uncharacterized protein [Dermacentor albipictus]|uniref:uncharacterized protein isoform X1 n=1 Tax=Dermacentor albipictus TaxID=60249 RepID=UPI0038FCB8CD
MATEGPAAAGAVAQIVGRLGDIEPFDESTSDWPSYEERLSSFLQVNRIPEDDKFLNTTEKIWTFLQSSSDKPKGISRTKTYWSSANILRKRKCYSKTWKHLSGDGCHIARWKNNNLHIELF